MTESWKPIKGYEGLYEVSNTGKVRSIDRVTISKSGVRKNIKGKELFFTISKIDAKGHMPRASVQLWKNNKARLYRVHRLVAGAFIENKDNLPTVNHIDGNPLNNNADNLEWCSYSDNQKHAYKMGLITVKRNYYPNNVRRVRAFNMETGEEIITDSCAEMGRLLGVCHQAISKCAKNNEGINYFTTKGYVIQYL